MILAYIVRTYIFLQILCSTYYIIFSDLTQAKVNNVCSTGSCLERSQAACKLNPSLANGGSRVANMSPAS